MEHILRGGEVVLPIPRGGPAHMKVRACPMHGSGLVFPLGVRARLFAYRILEGLLEGLEHMILFTMLVPARIIYQGKIRILPELNTNTVNGKPSWIIRLHEMLLGKIDNLIVEGFRYLLEKDKTCIVIEWKDEDLWPYRGYKEVRVPGLHAIFNSVLNYYRRKQVVNLLDNCIMIGSWSNPEEEECMELTCTDKGPVCPVFISWNKQLYYAKCENTIVKVTKLGEEKVQIESWPLKLLSFKDRFRLIREILGFIEPCSLEIAMKTGLIATLLDKDNGEYKEIVEKLWECLRYVNLAVKGSGGLVALGLLNEELWECVEYSEKILDSLAERNGGGFNSIINECRRIIMSRLSDIVDGYVEEGEDPVEALVRDIESGVLDELGVCREVGDGLVVELFASYVWNVVWNIANVVTAVFPFKESI